MASSIGPSSVGILQRERKELLKEDLFKQATKAGPGSFLFYRGIMARPKGADLNIDVVLYYFGNDGEWSPPTRFDEFSERAFAGDGSCVHSTYQGMGRASFAVAEVGLNGDLIRGIYGNAPADMKQIAASGEACAAVLFAEAFVYKVFSSMSPYPITAFLCG